MAGAKKQGDSARRASEWECSRDKKIITQDRSSHPVSINGGQELLSHTNLPTDLIHSAGAPQERLHRWHRHGNTNVALTCTEFISLCFKKIPWAWTPALRNTWFSHTQWSPSHPALVSWCHTESLQEGQDWQYHSIGKKNASRLTFGKRSKISCWFHRNVTVSSISQHHSDRSLSMSPWAYDGFKWCLRSSEQKVFLLFFFFCRCRNPHLRTVASHDKPLLFSVIIYL